MTGPDFEAEGGDSGSALSGRKRPARPARPLPPLPPPEPEAPPLALPQLPVEAPVPSLDESLPAPPLSPPPPPPLPPPRRGSLHNRFNPQASPPPPLSSGLPGSGLPGSRLRPPPGLPAPPPAPRDELPPVAPLGATPPPLPPPPASSPELPSSRLRRSREQRPEAGPPPHRKARARPPAPSAPLPAPPPELPSRLAARPVAPLEPLRPPDPLARRPNRRTAPLPPPPPTLEAPPVEPPPMELPPSPAQEFRASPPAPPARSVPPPRPVEPPRPLRQPPQAVGPMMLAPEPEGPTAPFALVPPQEAVRWPEVPATSPFDVALAPPPEMDSAELVLGAPNIDADGAPLLEFAAELALGAPEAPVDDVFELPVPTSEPAPPSQPPPPAPPPLPVRPETALALSGAESTPALPELEHDDGLDEEPSSPRQYSYQVGDSLEALASALGAVVPPPPPKQTERPERPPVPEWSKEAEAEKPAPRAGQGLRIQPKAFDVALTPRRPPTAWEHLQRRLRRWLGQSGERVSGEELAVFTRQMAAMIGAGIPIHQVLTFYAESGEGDLARVINDVATRVASGVRFSHALRSHPDTFSEVYCALIETGETSSQILEILEKLAELLEKQVRMRKRIISVVTYPAILLVVSFAAILGFVYFVLPMLEPLFKDVKMPLPTLILLKSRVAIPALALLALLAGGAYWLLRPSWRQYLARSPDTRYRVDSLPLGLPLFGKTIEKIVVARVLYSLATMLEAGITVIQALGRCASVAGNSVVARRVHGAIEALVGGQTVAEALGSNKVFPAGCIQLLCAGEEASSLSDTVRYAARFYEEEVELALTDLASMLEPAIMLGMGVIVGFIVLSAVLPTLALLSTL